MEDHSSIMGSSPINFDNMKSKPPVYKSEIKLTMKPSTTLDVMRPSVTLNVTRASTPLNVSRATTTMNTERVSPAKVESSNQTETCYTNNLIARSKSVRNFS